MAASKEVRYIKAYIRRMLQVNKAIEGQVARTQTAYNKIHKQVIDEIKLEFDSINSKRLGELSKEVKEAMRGYFYEDYIPSQNEVFKTIMAKESIWTSGNLTVYSGTRANIINPASAAEKALKKTFQGHTFNFWFKGLAETNTERVLNTLKAGYINGVNTAEITTNVESLLNRGGRDAKTLTRSYLQHAAAEAKQQTLDANADLIEEYIWLSTLDGRTTVHICGIRDGKRYDADFKPIGHSLSWGDGPGRIHFNCRSSYIPKLIGQDDLRSTIERPAIYAGKEYQEGDNKTRTGKIRKPTKANREAGYFNVKQVKGTTTYEDYLRRQKLSFISDVVGDKETAQKFKNGQLSLFDIAMLGKETDVNRL